MRIILTVIWAFVLFVFTCSVNFHLLIRYHIVVFNFNPTPDWSELLKLDFQWTSHDWMNRKIGHFFGFFILAILSSSFGKYKSAFFFSIVYAALTEILQLFFFRGGRIYDIANDSAGILFAYIICLFLLRKSTRRTSYINKEK